MNMTPLTVFLGSTLVILTVIFANIILPPAIFRPAPSANARPYTQLELEGREIYIQNGCLYCHSQATRPMDFGEGSGEAAEPGDYAYDSPHLIGSERNGPDLMREGGYHSDDWHWAHFEDPRYTRPQSFMPSFKFITGHDRVALIAYMQCLGGKEGVARADEQRRLKPTLISYYQKGPAENVAYLNSTLPPGWFEIPNPVPLTEGSVERGRDIYVAYCIGCHGENGDGRGSARPYLNPPPMDFTLLQASGANPEGGQAGDHYSYPLNKVSVLNNGAIYYAVLYGIPGSAMPQFKGQLESEKIWDVGNYVGWAFMGWKKQPAYEGRYDELSQLPAPSKAHLTATSIAAGKGA
jgi:cytochrome c oxidase cbb3-type subunit 2